MLILFSCSSLLGHTICKNHGTNDKSTVITNKDIGVNIFFINNIALLNIFQEQKAYVDSALLINYLRCWLLDSWTVRLLSV